MYCGGGGWVMNCLHGTVVWKLKPSSVRCHFLQRTLGAKKDVDLGGIAGSQTVQLTARQSDK